MATRKLAPMKTTAPARARCVCPLCSGDTIGADGVYHCRADRQIEYLVFFDGSFVGAYANYFMAETELNSWRRDALAAPVELAAAEADLDAQAEEYVAAPEDNWREDEHDRAAYEAWERDQIAPAPARPAEPLPFTPDNSPLDPRPTPPAISYSAAWGGFSWVGAPRVDGRPVAYPTFTQADKARAEWLKVRRSPRDARAVRDQLAARGLMRAAA